jgi:hypothetical protein
LVQRDTGTTFAAGAGWRALALGLGVAVALLLAACGEGGGGGSITPTGTPINSPAGSGSAICTAQAAQKGLITTQKFGGTDGVYDPGEKIEMTLTIVNCGDNEATLHFPSAKRYEFVIRDANGAEAWRSSDGKTFDQAEDTQVIQQDETIVYTESWDQKDRDGNQVPDGTYKVSTFSVGCIEVARSDCQFGPIGFVQIGQSIPPAS